MLAYSYKELGLFLLDEDDLSESDNVRVRKMLLPTAIHSCRFMEITWDSAYLVVLC